MKPYVTKFYWTITNNQKIFNLYRACCSPDCFDEQHCEYKKLNGCLKHFKYCSLVQLLYLQGFQDNRCNSALTIAPSAVREWTCTFIQRVSFSRSTMCFSCMLGLFTSECACPFDAEYRGFVHFISLMGKVFLKCIIKIWIIHNT